MSPTYDCAKVLCSVWGFIQLAQSDGGERVEVVAEKEKEKARASG